MARATDMRAMADLDCWVETGRKLRILTFLKKGCDVNGKVDADAVTTGMEEILHVL